MVPCYNEAERLDLVQFDEFLETHPLARVIFVDDASTDATASVLRNYCSRQPSCSMISLDRNAGKAEAVRRGMLAALDGGAPVAGYWDADLATPLRCVDELTEVLHVYPEVKAVLGSRVKMLGWNIRRKATRHYVGRLFATTVSLMLGIPVYDTQCGAKLFRNQPVVGDVFQSPFVSRWIFDVEILARLLRALKVDRAALGTHVREKPLSEWKDVPGSKVRVRNFFTAGIELLRIFRTSH